MNLTNIKKLEKEKNEINTTIDLSDESHSLICLDEKRKASDKTKNRKKYFDKSIEMVNLKNLPSIFFVIFLILLAMLTVKVGTQMYSMTLNKEIYKQKMLF